VASIFVSAVESFVKNLVIEPHRERILHQMVTLMIGQCMLEVQKDVILLTLLKRLFFMEL
jgi:hypothetical protein